MKISHILEATIFDERYLIDHVWASPKELMQWLKANGYKKIGHGSFARVFLKGNSNRIVKVSSEEDDAWIKFATYAMRITSNPHLPKIYWVKQYNAAKGSGYRGKFFVSIIERLTPIYKNSSIRRELIDNTVDLVGLAYLSTRVLIYDDFVVQRFLEEKMINENDNIQEQLKKIVRENSNSKFMKTLDLLENIEHYSTDFHSGNFMYRPSTRNIVITDPLV